MKAKGLYVKISVVIPTLNEAGAIGGVVRAVPKDRVQNIFVVDNGSTDDTAKQATLSGARVVHEPRRGYGSACLAGAKAARESDIIVFLDGDRSDDPRQLDVIAMPVVQDQADLVIGSRIGGVLEKGAMPLHGQLGNRLIVRLLRLLYGVRISDIDLWMAGGDGGQGGPQRATNSKRADNLPQTHRDVKSYGYAKRNNHGNLLHVLGTPEIPWERLKFSIRQQMIGGFQWCH